MFGFVTRNLSGFIITVGGEDEENKTITGVTENAISRSPWQVERRSADTSGGGAIAREQGGAFVPWFGGNLEDTLCERIERRVGNDNCVRFEKLSLQIPADQHRCHYVKAKVKVHRYPDGSLAVFHGPRRLAQYAPDGKPITTPSKQVA